MNTVVIREKLHGYVDNGDEKLLKLLFALAKEYIGDDDYEFTSEELKEFEKRRQDRINGLSKALSWDEAKAKIINGNISDL